MSVRKRKVISEKIKKNCWPLNGSSKRRLRYKRLALIFQASKKPTRKSHISFLFVVSTYFTEFCLPSLNSSFNLKAFENWHRGKIKGKTFEIWGKVTWSLQYKSLFGRKRKHKNIHFKLLSPVYHPEKIWRLTLIHIAF